MPGHRPAAEQIGPWGRDFSPVGRAGRDRACGWPALGPVPVLEDPGRVRGRLGAAFHAKLGEQRGDVVLHRLLGQEHALADLPVGQPLPDQLQDPPLLPGQCGQRVGADGLIAHPAHHLAGRLRVQQRLPRRDRADGAHQVGAADLLQHVPGRPGHDRVKQRIVIAERGQHQTGHLRHPGPGCPGRRSPRRRRAAARPARPRRTQRRDPRKR